MGSDIPALFEAAGVPADLDAFAKGASAVAQRSEGNALGGKQLLKLVKGVGNWVYGADSEEIEEGDRVAVNPASMTHGWVDWFERQPVGEHMVSITEELPDPNELDEAEGKQGWSEQVGFDAQFVGIEELTDVVLLFKSNSMGAREAFRKLAGAIVVQLRGEHDGYFIPVITLGHSSYEHKEHGTIYKPVFTLVAWGNVEGELFEIAEDAPPAKKKAPASKKKASAKKSARRRRA